MTIEIFQFPCLEDNYGYLLHEHESGCTASIDSPDVEAIIAALQQKNWKLTHIFNTHHHWDHVDGNLELKRLTNCKVVGSEKDKARIPGIDICVNDDEKFLFGDHQVTVQETSGHTVGHIVYHLQEDACAFVGDTIFSLGCGRLFEGSPEQMWHSLQKIMEWPDATKLYCSHEYTQANAEFALSLEPHNKDLEERVLEVERLRLHGESTIPTTVGLEKATNPFLRPDSLEIQQNINMMSSSLGKVFEKIRALKDTY